MRISNRVMGLLAGCVGAASAQTFNVNLKGTVLDGRSGVLINNATVTLAGNPSLKATTDAEGNFTLSGQVVGLGGGSIRGEQAMTLSGGDLGFRLEGEKSVIIDVVALDNRKVKTLVDARLGAGSYKLSAPTAGLPAGLYVVRGRVGSKATAFRMSSMGLAGTTSRFGLAALASAPLAKSAAEIVDTLKVVRDGYATVTKPITKREGLYQIAMQPRLGAGDLKIVSERGMPQVNWGLNVDVQVWDGSGANGTQLQGNFPTAFEGKESWMVSMVPGQSYSAWGFIANKYPEDMSAWANGAIHLAVKGTVNSLGVTMASPNQPNGMSVKVDLREFGYKPDNKWYEMSIPVSKFEGTDMSRVSIYCGLVTPTESDTIPFDTDGFYQVDDIYWKVTK